MDKKFNDYQVANISADDVSAITELEHKLKERSNKDIVIIAYQPNDNN